MAWKGTHLLALILVVLLASESWEQRPVLLQKLEGETISLKCPYRISEDSNKMKTWCKKTSENVCIRLVTSSRSQAQESRYSIQDDRRSGFFKVTMTGLRTTDSGFYSCGTYNSLMSIVYTLKNFHLIVSQVSTPSTTRSTVRITVRASVTSFATDRSSFQSSPGNWKFILSGVLVAILLLLLLTIVLILYLRKARGRAEKGEDESHHIYDDVSVQKEKTTGFDQQIGSDEGTGGIHYASLIHLNSFGTEDSTYTNTHTKWKPMPDSLLFVEYVTIAGNKHQPSKSTALEESLRN